MSGEGDDAGDAGATIVGGRFERLERLDSGGLGTVWRGLDRETGAPVAIKADHDEVHDSERVRAGFREELRWFRRLSAGPTPGSLVQFVDGAVGSGGCFVATELLEGGPLETYFAGDRTPGTGALAAVAPSVCRAVDFLHRNGVVHRDVKPSNVLERRREDGPAGAPPQPVLVDLNSAVAAGADSDALFHHDPSKPPELTPTELRDEPVGPPADVYALGTLCCFLLAGETPTFESESLADWTPVDPREYGADCDGELARVVGRATEPRPDDRYPDSAALYDALAPHLGLPDRAAELVDERTDHRIRVRPGDAVGRWTSDLRVPHVVLPDPARVLSPVHASLEWDGSDWVLVDRSLNGTYVARAEAGDEWEYAISAAGLERRSEAGTPPPVADPPETIALADGDRIAPVSPDAGFEVRFEVE